MSPIIAMTAVILELCEKPDDFDERLLLVNESVSESCSSEDADHDRDDEV